jgi:hypothetical protein
MRQAEVAAIDTLNADSIRATQQRAAAPRLAQLNHQLQQKVYQRTDASACGHEVFPATQFGKVSSRHVHEERLVAETEKYHSHR